MRRLLVLAALAALAALVAGCGGEKTVTPAPETVVGTVEQPTVPEAPAGDPAKGKEIFTSAGCGGCHTLAAAGSSATVGPNLDETLQGRDPEFILESIVNPDAQVTDGFQAGIMPKDYGQRLDDQQLADLVAFLAPPG